VKAGKEPAPNVSPVLAAEPGINEQAASAFQNPHGFSQKGEQLEMMNGVKSKNTIQRIGG
jgi:hypothetical protein